MEQYNGIPIRKVNRIGLPEVSWRQLHTSPRVPFADPVVEALYQAGWNNCHDGMTTLDAITDAEEIVAIVRAAIAQHAEDPSA